MGKVVEIVDLKEYDEKIAEVGKNIEKEELKQEEFADSTSFSLILLAKKYDDWFLDPIVGFFIPGLGDLISSAAILPALYIAIFKLHSFKLSFAIFYVGVLDLLVGLIPVLGDLIDAFYKANKKAARWIVGYVEDDAEIKSEIDSAAVRGVFVLALIGLAMYLFYEAFMGLIHWIQSLF